MIDDREEVTLVGARPEPSARRLQLVVGTGAAVTTYSLPFDGEVTVGRGTDASIQVNDPSVSRVHVRLLLGGDPRLQDLGSANGTSIGGKRLRPKEWVSLARGQVAEIGCSWLMVAYGPGAGSSRAHCSRDELLKRIDDERDQARDEGGRFTVLALRVPGGAPRIALLDSVLRARDSVSADGGEEILVLLAGTSAEAARPLADGLLQALRSVSAQATVGTATYPADGASAKALLARASARARGDEKGIARMTLVVQDQAMLDLQSEVERAGQATANVFVVGEPGVGKRTIARRVHDLSARAGGPYVVLECGTTAPGELERQLFGGLGASGAIEAGALERAAGGTAVLVDPSRLPTALQEKLARALSARLVEPVGSAQQRPIDVRVVGIAASLPNAEVASGRLRQDVATQLAGMVLKVPPLRDRTQELTVLVQRFAAEAAKRAGRKGAPQLTESIWPILLRHSWPGNIRELRAVIEHALQAAGDGPIRAEHLPREIIRPRR